MQALPSHSQQVPAQGQIQAVVQVPRLDQGLEQSLGAIQVRQRRDQDQDQDQDEGQGLEGATLSEEVRERLARTCEQDEDVSQSIRELLPGPPDPLLGLPVRAHGATALHVAAKAGSVGAIGCITEAFPGATRVRDDYGFTAFSRAVEAGKLDAVKALLGSRPDSVGDLDNHHSTPLHRAAGNGHVDVTEFLLVNGAAVDCLDVSGETPLFYACRYGFREVAKLLLAHKADVNRCNALKETCVHLLVSALGDGIGDAEGTLKLLVQHGVNMNAYSAQGETPLMQAVTVRSPRAIEALVRAGANPDMPESDPVLHGVILRLDEELIRAFRRGLGREAILKRRCELSSRVDPWSIVGKHLEIVGLGNGFCVHAYRPILGIFGPITHVVRLDSGEEHNVILERKGCNGMAFALKSDDSVVNPLVDDADEAEEVLIGSGAVVGVVGGAGDHNFVA